MNQVIEELAQLANMEFRNTTPYNPRANGLAENGVKLSTRCIAKSIEGAKTNWDLAVPAQQFALNTRVATHHGSAPFSLFFARSFPGFRRAVFPDSEEAKSTSASSHDEWMEVVAQMEAVVFPAIRQRRDSYNKRMAERFDKSHRLQSFTDGSFVMARDDTRSGKFSPYFEGPYKVVKRNRGGAYLLLDHDGVLLHRAYAPAQLVSVPSPPEAPVDTSDIYTVDKILAHRKHGRDYEYLISWKDCDATKNIGEPAANFFDRCHYQILEVCCLASCV